MKNIILYSAFLPVFLGSCVFFHINNDFDVTNGYYNNNSTHNIYIQEYYLKVYNYSKNNIFSENGKIIEKESAAAGAPAADFYFNNLDKIIFIDTDTRKFLKKISAAEYFKILGQPEITVKKNEDGGNITYYNYYFIITDDFLNVK
ncbi:MAG: hypothetical protein FWC19_10150 [Treponema sp.]|nr:hypothetical protein [Treponema sp.]MCL2273149.1 hypothetical protein [Treponema sp.]